ncbi:hypothetical protein [Bythopirellula polymerisocia]|uniref:Uncharacterized protein n=1 Tax=Bythopirellula polymerisocia TaxID=2528003 RepID=A0A5C6CYP0_9BACT|nr:hypothetical protein [Bythopirellula polymerisocia]TWU28714.1 hypothetical protein Pla144_20060 [Bythopirellula polymerisocia]
MRSRIRSLVAATLYKPTAVLRPGIILRSSGQKAEQIISNRILRFSEVTISSFLISSFFVTILICPQHLFGKEVFDQQTTQQASRTEAETPLRWIFVPDDVIRVEMEVNETVVDDENKEYQTKRIYDYRWTVNSVDSDGTATLTVTFDRIQFHSEWFSFDYDSQTDDATVGTSVDSERYSMLYEFRAMRSSQFEIEVTSRGAVKQIVAAESVVGPMQFTPGDWPGLPEKPVKIGDSWTLNSELNVDYIHSHGQATYELVGLERKDEKLLCDIRGKSLFSEHTGLPPKSEIGAIESKSHFDPKAGMFVDEMLSSKLRSEIAPGENVSITVDVTRRIFPCEKQVEQTEKNGEYLFVFDKGIAKPIVLAGVPVGVHNDPVSELLHLNFYHTWTDTDKDGMPIPEELTGISTRFAAGDPVHFSLIIVGLKDAELYFNILCSQGRYERNVIPIRDNIWYAMRTVPELEPGVYFFEFFVNERHLVRVPIQVAPSLDP